MYAQQSSKHPIQLEIDSAELVKWIAMRHAVHCSPFELGSDEALAEDAPANPPLV